MRNELRRTRKAYTPCYKGIYVIDFIWRNSQSSLRPMRTMIMCILVASGDRYGLPEMQIEIQLTTFYSRGDELRFFQGLKEIGCIQNVKGVGRGLVFDIALSRLRKENLFELIGLLWRYQIDLTPLRALSEKNKKYAWLTETKFYWHEKMYSHNIKHGEHSPGGTK